MRSRVLTCLLAAAVVMSASATALAQDAPDRLDLYSVTTTVDALGSLRADGFDVTAVRPVDGAKRGTVTAELVASGAQAAALRARGLRVEARLDAQGRRSSESGPAALADGFDVWRSYSEPGGIADEMRALAEEHPDLLELQSIGTSVGGQDILALRLTKDAPRVRDGMRPAVLYVSAQHAREWISPEVNRRLVRHMLDGYGTDPTITGIVDTTELWFVLVANPDGYDHTFTDGNRLWRKNLRDNDGDGEITASADGVDLNRNFASNWGYDDEGSSPDPASDTYRGPGPGSEPETEALDGLMERIDFSFLVNYHSAAELLLYGVGWQVATPTPDDLVNVALNGTDDDPAVPGYDPDLSAELYTTNGDTTDHAGTAHGILAYTPELDTCESAEAIFDDDEYGDTYCEDEGRSVFEFPDDEDLVQAVFAKNLDYAVSIARSAQDPAHPVTTTGLVPPDLEVDTFEVSHGAPQTVAVTARRALRDLTMRYQVDDGPVRRASVREWEGGERYGSDHDTHYAEYRGVVGDDAAEPGDEVTVWFEAREPGDGGGVVSSEPFTYTLASDTDRDVLVVADEDYEGFNPEQAIDAPAFVDTYGAALDAGSYDHDVWDVTAQGVPHDLGVLSHYDAVVWELGANRLTQEAEDVLTETPAGQLEDLQVAESAQYLQIAMRDYLNEGGKILHAGQWTGFFGQLGAALGGAYYGLNGDPTADCVVTESFFGDCLIYSNDFAQYYLGAYDRQTFGQPDALTGTQGPLDGLTITLDPTVNPDAGGFIVTSDILAADDFPQFSSASAAEYVSDDPLPLEPFGGDHYAAAPHADSAWMRLTTTVDLTDATSGELAFALSADVEDGYDQVIVEAHPVGSDDWTTLPDVTGGTSQAVPAECEAGFFIDEHPFLDRYLTLADPCEPAGTTGAWHARSSTSGWVQAAYDLSPYAGQAVEVSISYVTDPGSGGFGVFVDDTRITVDGLVVDANDFETGLGAWSVSGPPATSPGNATDWIRSTALFEPPAAAVTTQDTVTLGFGIEAITDVEARNDVVDRIMRYLLDG